MSNEPTLVQPTTNRQKMDCWPEFRTALDDSAKELGQLYFRVPRSGQDPAWRERAYCYELYHLLRCKLSKDFPYTLHGEIDKAGHVSIMRHFGRKKRPNPDFIVHKPGDYGRDANLVVIEVKISEADIKRVKEDLWKIRKFMKNVEYQHGIMLFFGEQQPPDLSHLGKIEVLWHKEVGRELVSSKKGKFS